jgi:tRNA U34 2-thiouridine synthase MnmA/TrmU
LKAIALLSGGLDSILAVKLILDQGIAVEGVNFLTLFCASKSESRGEAQKAAAKLGIDLEVFSLSQEYLEMVKHPQYGYGKNVNPCIDCRIFMLKEAGEYMKARGASFLITGEVLGERPMSQRRDALRIVERDSGLKGLILRPLSAKLLEPTLPEERGWVDRQKLLALKGRSRKPQMELAAGFGLDEYPSPAGGCLLTDPGFAGRFRDLLKYDDPTLNGVQLLKIGRHFRLSPGLKIIVGRNDQENKRLITLSQEGDHLFRLKEFPGPLTLARGFLKEDDLNLTASFTAGYSKAREEEQVQIDYWRMPDLKVRTLTVSPKKSPLPQELLL